MPHHKAQRRKTMGTLIYETGEREDDALSRLQWVVPVVFLATTLIMFIAVMEWLSPVLPLMLFVGLVWVPVGLALVWKVGRGKGKSLLWTLAVLGMFGLPPLAWNSGHYRAAAFWVVSDMTPFDVSAQAAADRSDLVVSLACERVLLRGELRSTQWMQGVLAEQPEVAAMCLPAIYDDERATTVSIARHLQQTWYRGWLDQEDARGMDPELGCAAAKRYMDIGALYANQGVPELLMCSLGAEREEFSTCCAQALSAHTGEEEILRVSPEQWIGSLEVVQLFLALTRAVDLPAQTLMAAEPVDGELDWTPADLFHWTTHLGCHLMEVHDQPDAIARQLSKTIDTQCGLDVEDPLFSFAAVQFVERTCAGVDADERQRVDVVEWCEVAREANRGTAVDAAKFLVYRARRNYGLDGMEQALRTGFVLAQRADEYDALFGSDERRRRRFNQDIGTDGVRLQRPSWVDHSHDSRATLEAMRRDRLEQRQNIRSELRRQQSEDDPGFDRQVERALAEERSQQREELVEQVRQRVGTHDGN